MDNHRIKIKIKFGYTIFILKMRNPLTLKIDNCSGDASGMQENDFDVTQCALVTFNNNGSPFVWFDNYQPMCILLKDMNSVFFNFVLVRNVKCCSKLPPTLPTTKG